MTDRCCGRCAFVGRVHNGDPEELICVNYPLALGEPVRVPPDHVDGNRLHGPYAYLNLPQDLGPPAADVCPTTG